MLSINLHSIRCTNETGELSDADEVYVLVTAANLRPPIPPLPIPPLPDHQTVLYGVFEGMNDNDPEPVFVDGPPFWGLDARPAVIVDPTTVAVVVSVIEHDNGVPEQYQEAVALRAAQSLAASLGNPSPTNRATRLTNDIRNVLNGLDIPFPIVLR
jgi:hypothetical protein